jgi:hypothetical protein
MAKTEGKTASAIPQEVRRGIIRLNEIRVQILTLHAEHDSLSRKIAGRLIPVVVGQ